MTINQTCHIAGMGSAGLQKATEPLLVPLIASVLSFRITRRSEMISIAAGSIRGVA
ncbi:hypothetical protein C4K19_0354 [Pseudomonas chlororaphis subsp. aurantiaca]|uniref:hypothetical protein n=1 Tax=Pseudomonas chlororaphis TaxID=587753 RepID=UPI000F6FD262|nr:hypothetical protein [Pseudomonas chlororaphis]AZD52172.1 hypothetical protein C4K19_0354 [Pseudomonas chlororaphis subsp. aurantiaca]AZD58351.1 hypothetical protein C4K18_0347 [Pseudomonas chlororaphis subsp. aurantiaca]